MQFSSENQTSDFLISDFRKVTVSNNLLWIANGSTCHSAPTLRFTATPTQIRGCQEVQECFQERTCQRAPAIVNACHIDIEQFCCAIYQPCHLWLANESYQDTGYFPNPRVKLSFSAKAMAVPADKVHTPCSQKRPIQSDAFPSFEQVSTHGQHIFGNLSNLLLVLLSG